MASRLTARLTVAAALIPSMGSMGAAANQYFPKGTIVQQDEAGLARSPTTADVSGLPAAGVSSASYDNRTGSPEGGLDNSLTVELMYGVFAFDHTGTTPKPRDRMFIVDNQTLSVDSLNGTRGFAGICSEVRTENGVSQAFVYINPISALGNGVTGFAAIPLTSFVDPDGDPLAKFADGASAVPGFNLADSEAFGIRWNNHAAPNLVLNQHTLPPDVDASQPMYLEFLCSKTGATLADATTLLVTAFLLSVGNLHDADANAGGTTNAMTGDAAAKTTALLYHAISAANNPTGVKSLTFTVKPTDGTLGTDDFIIHAVGLRYTPR